MTNNLYQKGFTLLEVMMVISIIATAVVVVISLANPLEQFAGQRNDERESDIIAIMDAISQYKTENEGVFNCATTFADSSGENNAGECSEEDCPEIVDDGRFGKAVRFNGSNKYIFVPAGGDLDISGDLTLSLWVRSSVDSSDFHSSWNYFLWHKDPNQSDTMKYEVGYFDTDGPRFKPYNDSGTSYEVDDSLTYASGTWHHVAGVRSGSSVEIYSDGSLIDSRSDFSGDLRLTGSGGEIRIGGDGGNGGFEGDIDEFLVYDRALSQSEVENLSKGIVPSGAKLLLNFNAGVSSVPTSTTPISSSGFDIAECLVPNYIQKVPLDPNGSGAYFASSTDYDSGYTISRNENTDRITIYAPSAELDQSISLTR